MFYCRTNKPATISQPKCEKIIPTYDKQIKDGKVKIVETGKTNIYEKIQASKDATLVYNILDRYNAGDVEALNQRQGSYGDFSNAPKTLAEAQQQLINAEAYFESLPLEVRKEFNHSLNEFLTSVSKGNLAERHEYFKAPAEVKPVENIEQSIVVQTPTIITPGGSNE